MSRPPTVHPFPARMAPDLALSVLKRLPRGSHVVDPMCGSGTVLRYATDLHHTAIGADMDPLAVLMSKVWTSPVNSKRVRQRAEAIVERGRSSRRSRVSWIDQDLETREFVDYWFAEDQSRDLRRLALQLHPMRGDVANVLRLALSRIIVTKERGASLARDVSHSRPHRVTLEREFDVMPEFLASVEKILHVLETSPPSGGARVVRQDGRFFPAVATASADCVLTSPPYLNAIDYLRGHRLALVWLGKTVAQVRAIRSSSVGTERGLATELDGIRKEASEKFEWIPRMPQRWRRILLRYVDDLGALALLVRRVLKDDGLAVFVIGDSTLRGTYVRNSDILKLAMNRVGFRQVSRVTREIPPSSRYLPPPSDTETSALANRMRTETVFKFRVTRRA